MPARPLTVEIFSDAGRHDIDVPAAIDGIEKLKQVVPQLEIVRTTGLVELSDPEDECVDMKRIPFIQCPSADMHIIMTNRVLPRDAVDIGAYPGGVQPQSFYGLTFDSHGFDASRVSIIAQEGEVGSATVQHEASHLLGVKRKGASFDGGAHCIDAECLMYVAVETTYREERPLSSRSKSILSNVFGRNAVKTVVINARKLRTELCDECAEQLQQNASYLQKAKAGELVPYNLIP